MLLEDARRLQRVRETVGRTGPDTAGRPLALNRATVVVCVSAWEAYIEELVRETVTAPCSPAPPLGLWPGLNAAVRAAIGRFNTPNTDQVRVLIADAIGLQDIHQSWTWFQRPPAGRGRGYKRRRISGTLSHTG